MTNLKEIKNKPSKEIINDLQMLLKRAEEGKMKGFAVAWVENDTDLFKTLCTCKSQKDIIFLITALENLKLYLNDSLNETISSE